MFRIRIHNLSPCFFICRSPDDYNGRWESSLSNMNRAGIFVWNIIYIWTTIKNSLQSSSWHCVYLSIFLFQDWKEQFFIKVEVVATWEASEDYIYYNKIILEYISFFHHTSCQRTSGKYLKQTISLFSLSLCLSF